jgi:hypothetical protein
MPKAHARTCSNPQEGASVGIGEGVPPFAAMHAIGVPMDTQLRVVEQLLRDAGLSSADWHDLLLAAAVPRHVVMLVEVRQRAWVMDLLPCFELVSFQVDASKLEVLSAPCSTVLVPRTARVYPTPTGRDGRSLTR